MNRSRRRHALLAAALLGALPAVSAAQNVSAPAILQMFEARWQTIERRAPDIFLAGYGGLWTPPPSRAESGDQSVGYDVYDRFDLGYAGRPTLYGTETGLKTTVQEMHKIGVNVYTDMILNHNGFADLGTPGFTQSGGYPGFILPHPNDIDGDFHGKFESGDFRGRTSGLIDIAQWKNHQYVRNPVPGFANNLPAGTPSSYAGGTRVANVATEANRRFYPDRQGPSQTYWDPAHGQNVTYYEYNSADPSTGDPVSENAMGYLMRHARWMVQEIGVDGFRLDATKHVVDLGSGNPDWVLEYFDTAVYRAIKTPLLDGSQKHVFSFGEFLDTDLPKVQTSIRKDINNTNVSGNRDALDFAMHYALKNNLSGNGTVNDWRSVVNTTQDRQDDGLANNGSQGVAFDASHDDGGAHLGNVANAYLLMRPGNAIVYMNAKEFGSGRDFPKDGRGDALGGLHGNTITKLVEIRNSHGRGNYRERWIDKETLVYERSNALIAGYSNRLDSGYDQRNVQTDFAPGTRLIDLTGNATDATIDPLNDLFDVVTVDNNGRVTIRIPRNKAPGANGAQHNKGYVIYGPATPRGTLEFTNVARTLGGGTPTASTNGTTRLASIDVIKTDAFDVKLQTIPVILPDGYNDLSAAGDSAILRFNGGIDVNGNGVVDSRNPGSVAYGFEAFTTKNSPLFGGGDGEFIQTIDATQLEEGYHYVTARAFRQRDVAGTPLFTDFRKVIYVDRERPQSAIADLVSFGGANRDVIVKSLDKTATGVHVFHNLGAEQFTPEQLVQMAAGGQNAAGEYDRDLFKYGVFNLRNGNHAFTVVTFEISYDASQGFAGGGVNVQRFAGIGFNAGSGAGLGDLDFSGTISATDVNLFQNVLQSNNASFNPAGDLNADGLIDESDNVLMVPWLTHRGANAPTIATATSLRLTRALALDGTLHVPAGALDVSGTLVPGVGLVFTNAFSVPGGRTITKTGGESLTINGTQSHGTNAALHVAEGALNLNSNAGPNLAVSASGAASQINFGSSQNLRAVSLDDDAVATIIPTPDAVNGGKVLRTRALSLGDGGKLDLTHNNLIVDYIGASPIVDVTDALRRGRDEGSWNGSGGIVSSLAGAGTLYTLGVAEASEALGLSGSETATWFGQTVDATSVLVKFTYDGDANLDGIINIDDYGQIDFHVSLEGVASYFNGDFNYDGLINIDDYGIIDFNVGIQGAPIGNDPAPLSAAAWDASAVVTAVPEPATALAPAALLLAAALERRRRHRDCTVTSRSFHARSGSR